MTVWCVATAPKTHVCVCELCIGDDDDDDDDTMA